MRTTLDTCPGHEVPATLTNDAVIVSFRLKLNARKALAARSPFARRGKKSIIDPCVAVARA